MVTERHGASDAIFQFSYVAGPIVVQQAFHRRGSDLQVCARGVAIQEMMNEHRNIGAAVAQRGEMYGPHVSAEVEILAEGAVAVCSRQVTDGCSNHDGVQPAFIS